ncbi:MAG TPA: sialidase family protein [Acidimicrobiales bacterium]|nr:sialidase family protein [Acidimicrobiales bacterium]
MSQDRPARGGHRPETGGRRVGLALGLVVAGLVSYLVLPGPGAPRVRRLGANLPVNAGALDRLDVSANNSPVVVANPRHPSDLVVANRAGTPAFSCRLHTSGDGGSSWAPVAMPQVGRPEVAGCLAPDIAYGPDGTLYLAFTSLGEVPGQGTVPDALWVATSGDNGRTFTTPVLASGPLVFHVRLVADPGVSGRLYLTWLQASQTAAAGVTSTGNPIVVSRSDDAGATWGPPVPVGAPRRRAMSPAIGVGDAGELYVAFLDVEDDRLDYTGAHEGRGGDPYPGPWALVASRSKDHGATWAEVVVETRLTPVQRFITLYPPAPSLAVDRRRHRVYLAFHDGRLRNSDVFLWTSGDGGRRWAKGRRVNDTSPADATSQYLPQLAVAEDGRLDVIYNDRRGDPTDVMTGVSLQSSFDGGTTFTSALRLSDRDFDSRVGYGAATGLPDLGNRLGLVSRRSRTLAVWTDTRGGSETIPKQDLAKAVVTFSTPRPFPAVLRWGILLIGVTGLLGVMIPRRRPRRQALP